MDAYRVRMGKILMDNKISGDVMASLPVNGSLSGSQAAYRLY
jgi:hypothetical protein